MAEGDRASKHVGLFPWEFKFALHSKPLGSKSLSA
jgi:hypothetical protein